ncbi:hypothetical protein Tco_1135185 [Tanacetum coccineum]
MSKMLYTRFTKLIIDYILSHNKSIPRISDSKLHSSQGDQPITKVLSTTNGEYKFGMEVPDAMISDSIKKKVGYTFYMAKKVESEKAKIVDEPEEQHVSLVKSGRGKEAVVGGLANSISIHEPRSQRRRRSQLKIDSQTNETVKDMYNEWGQKLKGTIVDDPVVQSLLDLRKGSKDSRLESLKQKKQPVAGEGSSDAHNKYYSSSDNASDATLYSSSSDKSEESAKETDDADKSNMDLSNDNPHGDDDDAMYGVFTHNKSTATPNSTYLGPTVTMYTDAQTTSVVHNPEGNPELTSYISCASEVPLGTHVDVLATKTLMQEMFPDENAHHIPSLLGKKIPYPTTTPQPNSLQAKAKKLMQKAKKNMRNINFKKAAVQAKVLTRIKTLLPTHIPNAIANYVKPRLNTFVLEQLYDTLYKSITLDQDALDAQAEQASFHKRSHDNQDPPNNCEGENKKNRRKDVGEPSSRLSRRNRSPVVLVQDDTPAMQPLDKADTLIQKHSNPEWFPKKSRLAKRRTTWFDLFLKSDIDKDENHILGPSTVAIAKKFKELIQKDELTIADLEGVGLEWIKVQYNTDVELEYHVSQLKATVFSEAQWNTQKRSILLLSLSIMLRDTTKKKWGYGLLTSIVVRRSDDQEYEFSYADLPRLSLNDVEDMYLLQVQDKLHHFPLEFVKDFNNALLMFIKRTVIKNRVEDIQLRVESYQITLNLTKPIMFFEVIDQRIPFTVIATHKGVLGSGNKWLKGRDWTDYDVKSLKEMLKKIDEILKHREQLRRLEEYVGGRPNTINPRMFVRPL